MHGYVNIILWAWIVVALLLFWRCTPRRAVLIVVIGGWALLPTARYDRAVAGIEFPYWIMPAAIPGPTFWTKATAIGVAALAGLLVFDRGARRRWRWQGLDAVMILFCAGPLLALVNYPDLALAGRNTLYLALAWGVPYLLGRLYLADDRGRVELAGAFVLGALAYLPICLVEGYAGPCVYRWCYGFHPYQLCGTTRWIGYRPIGWLEDGNQLGMWLAGAALVAWWRWRGKERGGVMNGELTQDSVRRGHGTLGQIALGAGSSRLRCCLEHYAGVVAGALIGLTVAAQSVGAIVLLMLGMIGLEMDRRWRGVERIRVGRRGVLVRWGAVGAIVLLMVGVAWRLEAAGKLEPWARHTEIGQRVVRLYRTVGRRTLLWRLSQEDRHMGQALANPILGSGRWDWWRDAISTTGAKSQAAGGEFGPEAAVTAEGGFAVVALKDATAEGGRPWSLWMLVWGMYGAVGVMSVYVLLLWPTLGAWRQLPRDWGWSNAGPTVALAGLLVLTAADSGLNGAVCLPILLVAGAIIRVERVVEVSGIRN